MRTITCTLGVLLSLAQHAGAQPVPLPAPPASPLPLVNYYYDANGNLTRSIVAPGFATSRTYGPLDRLKDVTDASGGVTSMLYNGHFDVTRVTDPRSLATGYQRNGFGEVTRVSSPDTGLANLSYDPAGNLQARTDSRGVQSMYVYDSVERLTNVVHSRTGQPDQGFGWRYDETGPGFGYGIGRLTSTAHPSGSTQYSYDAQGRILSDTQRVDAATGANPAQFVATVTYGYDAAGNVTSITYPSGRRLTISLDRGLPLALVLAAGPTATPVGLISDVRWEPFGAVRSWMWWTASGPLLHERLFDTAGRLVRYPLGRVWRDLTYDAAGRISSYVHYSKLNGAAAPSWDQAFGYDQLGGLVFVQTSTGSAYYAYDANGNRVNAVRDFLASNYVTASSSNRLLSTTSPSRSFVYDSAGNTTADGAFSATYDLAGRLATLTQAGVTTTYAIDGFGRRVRKFSSAGASSTRLFVYDLGGRLLGEYLHTGAPIREYVWLGNTPLAVFMPNPADAAGAPLVYYIHADHLDAPRAVVDTHGGLRWSWMAEPFGTTSAASDPEGLGTFILPLRLPGQYYDSESRLAYNGHRDYDARIGRYTQSDPIGLAGGINTYGYVENNPLSYVDPDGLQVRPRPGIPGIPIPGVPPGGIRDPDFPPGVGPNQSPAPWRWLPDWLTRPFTKSALDECLANCEEEKKERDALCFIAKAKGGKWAQAECLRRSDAIDRECRKKCEKDNCKP